MSGERTAEIWSTRLQRELLSLTTEATGDETKDQVSLLPPFISVKEHQLDIAKGICRVSFKVVVKSKAGDDDHETKKEEGSGGESGESSREGSDEKGEDESESKKDENDKEVEKKENEDGEKGEKATESEDKDDPFVIVILDASLGTKADGTIDTSPSSYPFQPPRAILLYGANLFPKGSLVKNGHDIDIDCDWTPSLHLNDAILNVALKIRESIKIGEPFFSSSRKGSSTSEAVSKSLFAFFSTVNASMSSAAASVKKIADEAGVVGATSPKPRQSPAGKKPTKKKPQSQSQPKRRQAPGENIQIGELLDLAQWSASSGMYACKAIRRPGFVETEMRRVAEEEKQKQEAKGGVNEDEDEVPSGPGNYMKLHAGGIGKVAGAGLAGAGSMFRSMTKSAKSMLEESFLLINDEHIIELKTNKFNIGTGTVTFAIAISHLSKLKFRRQESISLFFKQAPDDPFIFMCPESAECVQQIQSVLKRHGVRGKHTNAAMQRAIHSALDIVSQIQTKEKLLESHATVANVDEIMDLYRQAAEKFETAGDARHEEVMSHMRKFLAKPLTVSILDGSYQGKGNYGARVSSVPVPQGEVLDSPSMEVDDDDDDDEDKPNDDSDFKMAMKRADDMLEEAKRDMVDLDSSNLDALLNQQESAQKNEAGNDDPVAELDAMLSAADKELADIMSA